MPPQTSITQIHLNNLISYLSLAISTLANLEHAVGTPFLTAISNTTLSLLSGVQNVKTKRAECAQLLEHLHKILYAIISLHINSDTGGELPPATLDHIGKFTETLQKIHVFVESQQEGNKIKQFFRQSETNSLLKDCNLGLNQAIDVFKIETGASLLADISNMQKSSEETHNALLELIATLSDGASSDRLSSITGSLSDSRSSLNSLTMLPGKPKIFYGRESELEQIVKALTLGSAKIAILGAGGMGKTSLARATLHHPEIPVKYQNIFFIATDSVTTGTDLASLVAAHLGLQPGKRATKTIAEYFSNSPPSLIILDNLESSWESPESRNDVEEFLSCLTDVEHLSLIVTMRGAERPAKVQWTRPFLPPLKPLSLNAAQQTFTAIADGIDDHNDIEKLLLLTDNVPLAVDLIAHLVDDEGCARILSRWETEKTALLSDGYDKRSNLDMSITMSLSGPRMTSSPGAKDLLSLLSILPDGLSDRDLIQSDLPIPDILAFCAPSASLIHPVHKHFHLLLKFYTNYIGSLPSAQVITRVTSNLGNVQNILMSGFHSDDMDLRDIIECTLYLNAFRRVTGLGRSSLMNYIPDALAKVQDPRLWTLFMTHVFNAWSSEMTFLMGNSENMIIQAQEHFLKFNDPAAEAKFYNGVGFYFLEHNKDPTRAKHFFERAISLSKSSGKSHQQCYALVQLCWIERAAGDYSVALGYVREARKLAEISGNLLQEARALRVEGVLCLDLGLYPIGMDLCNKGRELLHLCGLSGSIVDVGLLNTQGGIHACKSEYVEARSINSQVIHKIDQSQWGYGLALVEIAAMDIVIGADDAQVQQNLDTANVLFTSAGNIYMVAYCDIIRADLYLRQGRLLDAKTLLEKYCKTYWGKDPEFVQGCLYKLSDLQYWGHNNISRTSHWAVVFLIHALKLRKKLQTHQALRCLGDVLLHLDSEDTALSLFTVALEGFEQMDVHQSKGDCMLRLGDISRHHGDLTRAVGFYKSALPMFERSLQTKDVAKINARLAAINQNNDPL
ncbi:hypothetical protein C8R44DRAFT_740788 [Mycena epipterygia]|nr:hypothetical protein C8R44DRAFT_740788 [Mycena epipterygia]